MKWLRVPGMDWVFVSCDKVVGRMERGKISKWEMGTQGKKRGGKGGARGRGSRKRRE